MLEALYPTLAKALQGELPGGVQGGEC